MTVECNYKEMDRLLIEQFISGLNDDAMIVTIICKVPSDTGRITSKSVLAWVRRLETQRAQTAMLDSLKESREFDVYGNREKYRKQS